MYAIVSPSIKRGERLRNTEMYHGDVYSRFKLIAYSRERTWTNGLCFYLWVISWLRSHGATAHIVFTVDHGEERVGVTLGKRTHLEMGVTQELTFAPGLETGLAYASASHLKE